MEGLLPCNIEFVGVTGIELPGVVVPGGERFFEVGNGLGLVPGLAGLAEESHRHRAADLGGVVLAEPRLSADVAQSFAELSVAAVLDIGRRTWNVDIDEAMKAIRSFKSYRAAIDSDDAQEGTNSFTEKRPPVWKGR